MRPKKRVRIIEAHPSTLAFVLEVHGFRISDSDPELIICDSPEMALEVKSKFPLVPVLLLSGICEHVADARVGRGESTAVLLEWVKKLTTRKRGPRRNLAPIAVEEKAA